MKTNDIVYGVHAVTEALLANTGNKLYLQEDLRGKNVEKVKELATEKKVSISWTSKKSLSEMTEGAVHQGFVLRLSEFAYSELEHILAKTRQEENPLLLILDGLTDPHNLGSILRTADATNVSGVIIPKHRAVGVTPVVAKTATGAIEHVPIARVTNLSQTLDKLKDEGFWTFGTDMNGTPCHKWNTKGKIALIIGNEGKGISSNIKKQVDEMITIPMMRAIFPFVFHLWQGVPFISVPKVQNPSSLSLSRVWLRLVTRAIGTCSIAPVAVLATTGVTPTAWCLGMMTPETLVASAVLKMEPKL